MELENIINDRQAKLKALQDKGINPFGGKLDNLTPITRALADFKEGLLIVVSGRLMAKREHGKVIFIDLRDEAAKIQVYIKEDTLGKDGFELFQSLDIGDLIVIEGELFTTRTQEPTIKAVRLSLSAKSLRPLPEKWHGLKDVEIRYRQRYLDLISNYEIREIFTKRSKIVSAIRGYLDKKGYLEVETPMMHPIPGGAAGRPFKTHHNEHDMDLYLRIAPELYLKKLLVGGFEKVYEINRSFRNEGVSTRHNPEFTMLEFYTAHRDYHFIMDFVSELLREVTMDICGSLQIPYGERTINFNNIRR